MVDLMGEVGVVVFLLGGWTLAPEEIEKRKILSERTRE